MNKLFFVYNPYSGRSANSRNTISSKLFNIIDIWVKSGYDVTVRPTQKSGDAFENVLRICNSNEYDLVVCSGGDGTLNETVHGVMSSNNILPIGYIPTGSTNDFAKSVGIPKGIENCAKTIINGQYFITDYGIFNDDKIFTYVCAFGAFTAVTYETPQQRKNYIGHTAYIMEALKRLGEIKSYKMTFEFDNGTLSGEYVLGMITNSKSVGGMFTLKNVSFDDGLFEVILVKKPQNILHLQSVLSELINFNSNDEHSEIIQSFKTSTLKITSEEPIKWNLDGEFGGMLTNVMIVNKHRGLTILTKKSKKNNIINKD
ncbi:MAG: diacylglycerol/lipid kinase family protein [Oscillospiraceae bacterium]